MNTEKTEYKRGDFVQTKVIHYPGAFMISGVWSITQVETDKQTVTFHYRLQNLATGKTLDRSFTSDELQLLASKGN